MSTYPHINILFFAVILRRVSGSGQVALDRLFEHLLKDLLHHVRKGLAHITKE